MTNSLLFHNSFRNSSFYNYLKSINGDVLVYYYPRLGTYLKDVFTSIELNESQDSSALKKHRFFPFYFDQSENLQIQIDKSQEISTNLYIIPPDVKILSLIQKNIQNNNDNSNDDDNNNNIQDRKSITLENRIVFFPRKTEECLSWLNSHNSQNNHFFVDEKFVEFDYLPIDERLFLIPFIDFFYKVFEKQDFALLKTCADILTKIQFYYGKIPKVRIHGQISKKIYDIFLETTKKISDKEFPSNRLFNNLIIIDRTTDLLTLLLPQNSYDGCIEESFVLDDGMFSIPHGNFTTEYPITHQISNKIRHLKQQKDNKIDKPDSHQEKIQLIKGEIDQQAEDHESEITDNIHDYIKYRMILHDIDYLNSILEKVKFHRSQNHNKNGDIQEISINGKVYENSDLNLIERSAQSLLDLITSATNRSKEFVSYIQLKDQIKFGLALNFEGFKKSIQTFLYAEENALFATQLIMTWSMIKGSVPRDVFDEFCDEIEFRYGAQASEQLHFLQNINIISTNNSNCSYLKLKNVFNLSIGQSNNSNSEGYDGYIPLSVRVIQEDLETISGSFTKRKEENDDINMNQKTEPANKNVKKKSYIEMLSSTVGSRLTSFTPHQPKGMELFKTYFNDQYSFENNCKSNQEKRDKKNTVLDGITDNNEKTLVFFVGGVTQLELSWINWLTEKHFNGRSTIVTLTTGIFTADRFVKECLPCLREDHPSLKIMTDNAIKLYSTNHY